TGGLVTTATSGSGVGSYPITQSSLAATGNYAIGTFNGGTLTIDKADLYVTAAADSKTYGHTATDTGTLSGPANGASITPTSPRPGAAASAPVGTGSYAITATLADPSNKLANYTVHEIDVTLTVNKAVVSVTAGNATRSYGAANPA